MDNKSTFDIGYQKGQIVSHADLCKKVCCGCMGGIRYSKRNNTILLFMLKDNDCYNNYWENDTLFYMGMGTGNQSLDYYGNRRLADSIENETSVFLIERDSQMNCIFAEKSNFVVNLFIKKYQILKKEKEKLFFFLCD